MSQCYENVLIWSHFKPFCTKMICGIFTQSFDAFWGHSNILKINCKAVSTTASSIELDATLQHWWSYLLRCSHLQKIYMRGTNDSVRHIFSIGGCCLNWQKLTCLSLKYQRMLLTCSHIISLLIEYHRCFNCLPV